MGGQRIWEPADLLRFKRNGGRDPKRPPEDNEDGCPGAWYRAGFPTSVSKYERTILQGAIASNPLLDRCDDPLVLEAAAYLEHERLRHRNHWQDRFGS